MPTAKPGAMNSLPADQQAAINDALTAGIARKNTDLIKLALDKGANPNILLFAA
jgi:hypothetical protein